jgi:GT2 family glycosyltransferase
MKPILTVSIVLYNTPIDQLKHCFASLRLYSGLLYLYLIDNSPSDALRGECPSFLPHEYIHLKNNPGFGSGHNVAIKSSQLLGSTYHLVLNADVSFNTDVITPMLAYLDANPNVGHLMPKILNPDGSVQHLCKLVPTPMDLLFRRFLPKKFSVNSNRRFEMQNYGYNKIMFVPYLSGCFMLLRQDVIKNVGLFDERFFMYPEDIDLTRRIALNYDTIFFPEVFVTHQHGAESYKSRRMLIIHSLNIIKYFNKWGWFYDPIRKMLNKKALDQSPF